MLGRLLLLFTLIPALELVLLVALGRWLGFLPTLAVVLGTGVAGALLARSQGARVVIRLREELQHGRLPGRELLEAGLILLAGALLLTPGVLTDATGLLMLVAPVRELAARRIAASLRRRFGSAKPPRTIDVDFQRDP